MLKMNHVTAVKVPPSLQGYAAKMRLWDAIGLPPPEQSFFFDASGAYLPMEPLRSRQEVHDCGLRVAQIAQMARMKEESRGSLETAMSELIDNCFAHAGVSGPLHGLVSAQTWTKGRLLQIAIADCGMGIRQSFVTADTEEWRLRAQQENCCSLATELGASSKLTKDHAGYGLALARQLAEKNGGTMIVVSGTEFCRVDKSGEQLGEFRCAWPGTLIILEFDTSKPLSTQAVYQTWPPVRGYTDDDFDF